ncbi:hypothetical protein ABBQ38_005286 [Trebouxia sp. C0009 RCD-2024]
MPLTFQHTDHVSGELHDVFQSRYKAYGVEQIRVKIGVVKERRIIKKDHLVLSECSSYYSMQHGHHPSSTSVIELEI